MDGFFDVPLGLLNRSDAIRFHSAPRCIQIRLFNGQLYRLNLGFELLPELLGDIGMSASLDKRMRPVIVDASNQIRGTLFYTLHIKSLSVFQKTVKEIFENLSP